MQVKNCVELRSKAWLRASVSLDGMASWCDSHDAAETEVCTSGRAGKGRGGMRLLDLFCGRWGWSREFARRGWEVVGVDLVQPDEIPKGCAFIKANILGFVGTTGGVFTWHKEFLPFDFIVASSPCEQFSVHGMKHFHPDPDYPRMGIKLFNHTRELCEDSGLLYVMENVRPAQDFVGLAENNCGPFYLWGNAVPPIMPQGITKGIDVGSSKAVKKMTPAEKRAYRAQFAWNQAWSSSKQRKRDTAKAATIPPELANCVADYAERLLEAAA